MAILKDLIVNGASRFIGDAYFLTIKAGTWNGNTIDVAHGGTGATSLTSGYALVGNGTNAVTTRLIVSSVGTSTTATTIPTSGAVYSAILSAFLANDAMLFAGTYTAIISSGYIGTFTTTSGITPSKGCVWYVSSAGYFGSEKVEIGDLIIAKTDNPGTTESNYFVILKNIDPDNLGKTTIITATAKINGDLNGDGVLDSSDIQAFIGAMGDTNDSNYNADVNNDGTVSITDMGILLDLRDSSTGYTTSEGANYALLQFSSNPFNLIQAAFNQGKEVILCVSFTGRTDSILATMSKHGNEYVGFTKHVTDGYLVEFISNSTWTYGRYYLIPTLALITAWNNKLDKLTFDTTPTSGSTNPVTSGGVYTALQPLGIHVAYSSLSRFQTNRRLYVYWDKDIDTPLGQHRFPIIFSAAIGSCMLFSWYDDENAYFSGVPYHDADSNRLCIDYFQLGIYNESTLEMKFSGITTYTLATVEDITAITNRITTTFTSSTVDTKIPTCGAIKSYMSTEVDLSSVVTYADEYFTISNGARDLTGTYDATNQLHYVSGSGDVTFKNVNGNTVTEPTSPGDVFIPITVSSTSSTWVHLLGGGALTNAEISDIINASAFDTLHIKYPSTGTTFSLSAAESSVLSTIILNGAYSDLVFTKDGKTGACTYIEDLNGTYTFWWQHDPDLNTHSIVAYYQSGIYVFANLS